MSTDWIPTIAMTLLLVLVLGCHTEPKWQLRQQSESDEFGEFRPKTVIPRAFPAIKDCIFITPDDSRNDVRESELVLGLNIGGEARAYPINMLTGPTREIINDQLGGRNIAATW